MTNNKQELHSAFILHTRSYRETSKLVEIFSSIHGRVAAIAKGAMRGKHKLNANLQLFLPVNLSWVGNGDLVTLTGTEALTPGVQLYGKNAICGLYINELLIKLLPKWDSCELLYAAYQKTLSALSSQELPDQAILREFEMTLLKSLGYALQLEKEIVTGATINPNLSYIFDPEHGPKLCNSLSPNAIKGSSLVALAKGQWQLANSETYVDIKRLVRIVLSHHLGTKRLVSRELL